MIVGSIKEDLSLEKRVALTPESAKNIINLGLSIILEKNYAEHLGIKDKEFEDVGVKIKNTSKDVLEESNLVVRVNCLNENAINNLKEKTILVGMFNSNNNEKKISEILKKNIKIFSLELLPRITRSSKTDGPSAR